MSKPEPLVISVTRESVVPVEVHPVVIQVPSPFPYKSDKAVPWKYGINVLKQEPKGDQKTKVSDTGKVTVDNITGIGGIIRSDRLFAPAELRRDRSHEKTNEEVTIETARSFLKGKAPQNNQEQEGNEKKEISDEEACEFLRCIQQSEYKVVDQLNRMPARISLLELLMHSTSHRKLLMKILNGAHVERDISLN